MMKRFFYPLLGIGLLISCSKKTEEQPAPKPTSNPTESVTTPTAQTSNPTTPTNEVPAKPLSAAEFLNKVEPKLKELWSAKERIHFVKRTHTTYDTELLDAKASEGVMAYMTEIAPQASALLKESNLSEENKRKLQLIILSQTLPAPADKIKQEELSRVAAKMESDYSTAKYCPTKDKCYGQTDLIKQMKNKKVFEKKQIDQLLEAWVGWHDQANHMRKDYAKFVALGNEGAKTLGYKDMGELWRANYDMSPAEFDKEVERLWGQVKPLYTSLHCYVRSRLSAHYGADKVPNQGLIPAHLLGNMWAQEWGNIYPLVRPYEEKPEEELDVEKLLKVKAQSVIPSPDYEKITVSEKDKETPAFVEQANQWFKQKQAEAQFVVKIGEGFFTSLGFPALPETFWQRSMLSQPRDREVECHASAEDMSWEGDVRLKMCTDLSKDSFTTVHHELGHDYYFLAYNPLPAIFQQSAHDGFHEAVGDTLTLSITPEYLAKIGLIEKAPEMTKEQDINQLLKRALDRVAFLPFGKTIDQWRWQVFSGEISPEHYNQAWWDLKAKYQGIAPPVPRTEDNFDPGAKYHVPGNTPYMRYFLARILQFQFHKALCKAAGYEGPLHRCSIYGSKEAGKKLQAMLAMGAKQPWPQALQALSGETKMDASALLEYFQPLQAWLDQQNQGQNCGW